MDFTALRDALKEGDFRKADDETRALLIRLAGEGAIKRGWVYWTEVRHAAVLNCSIIYTFLSLLGAPRWRLHRDYLRPWHEATLHAMQSGQRIPLLLCPARVAWTC